MKYYQCLKCNEVLNENLWNTAIKMKYPQSSSMIDVSLRENLDTPCPSCGETHPAKEFIRGADPAAKQPIDCLEDQELLNLLEQAKHPLTLRAAKRIRELLAQ